MRHCVEIPNKFGFGEVNQLHTGSRGGDNYEKANEETLVTNASMCHLSLKLRDEYVHIVDKISKVS